MLKLPTRTTAATDAPQWDDEPIIAAAAIDDAPPFRPGEIQLEFPPFPYQLAGVKFLYDRMGALLGCEMGTGKTMQSILAARLLLRDGKIKQLLIICPKTLIGNWVDEFKLWWKDERVLVCKKDRQGFLRSSFKIKLCHYEAITRLPIEFLEKLPPHDLVILDEAQRVRNGHTSTARAVNALPAARRWALTGTPLENRIDDLASIMRWCVPGDVPHDVTLLGFSASTPYFVERTERITAPLCHSIRVAQPHHARALVAPYMLRRLKEDVLPELPEKFEQDVSLDLLPRQRETYDRAEREGIVAINDKGDEVTVAHVFALIHKLRQICNFDPASGESCKIQRLLEDLDEIRASGRKTLIFSQFVCQDYGLARIARYLPAPLMIHGGVGAEDRIAAARRFNSHPSALELLLNFKCGGLGLNLQGASYVYLFDRWWNPAIEDQAISRVHRLGQLNKVFARKFVCRDTIEHRILEKLAAKRRLALQVLGGASAESCGLTQEELFSLFNLKVRPKKAS